MFAIANVLKIRRNSRSFLCKSLRSGLAKYNNFTMVAIISQGVAPAFFFFLDMSVLFLLHRTQPLYTKLAFVEQEDERYRRRLTARLGPPHRGERLRWAIVSKDVPPHCGNRSDCSRNRSDCPRFCVGKS